MPRFFADECVGTLIVEGLAERGFDVEEARTLCPGDSDDRALALSAAAGRVVITEDRGFGELAIRRAQPALGVVILALHELPSGRREEVAVERISSVAARVERQLVIIEPARTRVRPLPRAR